MKIETALSLLFGVMCAVAGVLFRPFWLSEWGPPTFILLVWLTMSLVLGWGGKGKPYSLRFGVACGSTFAVMLLVAVYTNPYVGVGVWLALVYFGMRTKFWTRRIEQLKFPTTE